MKNRTKNILLLLMAVIAEFAVLIGLILFQQNILMNFSLPIRAILIIVVQWALLIVPVVFMLWKKMHLKDIGFNDKYIIKQILTGLAIAVVMSLAFTVVPILLGFKDFVGNATYTKPWQFVYQFVYMTIGVALAEEVFYRGFLFKYLLDLNDSKWFAIIISSLIFGLSHIFNGNIIQVYTTFLLGIFFCLCREKIKNCSLLSLIIAHGFHNSLITLLVALL